MSKARIWYVSTFMLSTGVVMVSIAVGDALGSRKAALFGAGLGWLAAFAAAWGLHRNQVRAILEASHD